MNESTPTPATESSEPLYTVGTITAAATAVIALLIAFGLPISDDPQSAILGVVAVAAPLVVAAIARGRVYSPATVSRLLARRQEDLRRGAAGDVPVRRRPTCERPALSGGRAGPLVISRSTRGENLHARDRIRSRPQGRRESYELGHSAPSSPAPVRRRRWSPQRFPRRTR